MHRSLFANDIIIIIIIYFQNTSVHDARKTIAHKIQSCFQKALTYVGGLIVVIVAAAVNNCVYYYYYNFLPRM